MIKKIFFAVAIFSCLGCYASEANEKVLLDQILDAHRAMVVLLAKGNSNDPLADNVFAARNAYSVKQELIEQLLSGAESAANSKQALTATSKALIDYSERVKQHPADLLAFSDLYDELEAIEKERKLPANEIAKFDASLKYFKSVLQRYRADYGKLVEGLKRGDSFETWSDYLKFLNSTLTVNELLQTYAKEQPHLFRYMTRGENNAKTKTDALVDQAPKIIWGNNLPEKTVVLTFDDGPHARNTPLILDILKQYDVRGYFFSLGKNLGDSDGKSVTATRNDAVVKRIVAEGHILANHSYSHAILTKLDQNGRAGELSKTNLLINKSNGQTNSLFRPPYGSHDKELDALAAKDGMISVMWNIDSMDWADPIPESIADRTMLELEKTKKGILLFHDIHKQSMLALPNILAALAEQGYRVVTLDGRSFSENSSGVPRVQAAPTNTYGKSWAVVIGINNYQSWPKLQYAVNDAQSVAEHLSSKLGFAKENIITLFDKDATSERITEVLGYQMADPKVIKENDRVFVFYAGHGATREMPGGKSLGYIIPVDADAEKFQTRGISMTQLNDFSALIPAKHVYFVMDSCYSGLALTRSGVSVGQSVNYIQQITGRKARQILTAGGADQQVADGGPGGHSIFTWTFLQALEGLADTDNNGYVTASELGTYVAPVVASYSDQTPAFGNLLGSEGGDFVFKVQGNAVAEINQKLVEESKRVEDEINSLRQNTSANMKRRLELEVALEKERKGEVVTASSAQRVAAVSNPSSAPVKAEQAKVESTKSSSAAVTIDRKLKANQLNESALGFFKVKKYLEAKRDLAEAVRLNPYSPMLLNNYAYMLDQLNENDEALKWYYRTVELDPKRIAVYLNLGDLMVKLGRQQDSIAYYERFLHLYPSYKDAKLLQDKMEEFRNMVPAATPPVASPTK
ncbi:polysaccharide deacetylase [Cellvibrio zantedeschiae]|uniref:Polysaccharide deacetylase n=1 Tax=Cellvibrio zantedeschiae TaxID=1237077 RepID=A0ABQ3B9S6_9GAMM|nr:polysaccharide deacetylase family protein [Cellvibrio zantedeschiae]GGY86375.1 polysaccharide deacetylase [Cellvibrio zantedeschiae]